MRRYQVSRGVERSLQLRGLSGVWVLAFILGQAGLLALSLLCLLLGVSALWILLALSFLMSSWTLLCFRISRKFPDGSLERLVGLRMMPRCLERHYRMGPVVTEDGTAPKMPNKKLFKN